MRIALNFSWDFYPGNMSQFFKRYPKIEKVNLPHNAVDVPFSYVDEDAYAKIFTYRKTFVLPEVSKTTLIEFEGVMLQFDLYINQQRVGHYVSGYLPVKANISEFVHAGENEIIVVVDGHEDPLIPPYGGEVDYLTGAGIYRPVTLYCYDGEYLVDQAITASATGLLQVKTEVSGNVKPTYAILDQGEEVARFEGDSFLLKNAHPWSIEDPYLYELVTYIGEETYRRRFGFRNIRFSKKGFFLNEKKVFLRGLNRHQLYPYVLAALPASIQKEDARFLKYELGCNCVRTSHYPQSEAFLDECDRIGLLVIDEIPGWQHIGVEPAWRKQCCDFARRMILKERNHPSLIAYELRIDESGDDHDLYSQIQKIKAELDPSRPSLGVRNFKDSECLEDIYAYNDFSGEDLTHGVDDPSSWKGAKGKAKLISESNGHMVPTSSFDPTYRQIEHALRHARVLDDAMGKKGLCGALSWCAFDYYTHERFGSLDHLCRHGVATLDRSKKPAAYFYQSQSDERPVLYVASSLQSSDYDAALFPPAIIFTNAEEVEVYQGKDLIGSFKPDHVNYPNLPHPPVIVDDWIGKRFNEPKISAKDAKTVIEGLNYSCQKGFAHLPKRLKLKVGLLMAKYHYSFTDIYNLYGKYINHWGSKGEAYTFIAKIGGKEVLRQTLGSPRTGTLEAHFSKDVLHNNETYDAGLLTIAKYDEYHKICHHGFDALLVEVEGPLKLLGPNLIHLEGGYAGIYVASMPVAKESRAQIKILGNGYRQVIDVFVV